MSTKKLIRVRDVMKTSYDLVDGMHTVADALKKMAHVETKMLIVDKRHENDEYGMVQLSDIAHEVIAKNRAPERVNLYEIMIKPFVGVRPEMNIKYCSRLFERYGLVIPVLRHPDGRELNWPFDAQQLDAFVTPRAR